MQSNGTRQDHCWPLALMIKQPRYSTVCIITNHASTCVCVQVHVVIFIISLHSRHCIQICLCTIHLAVVYIIICVFIRYGA